MRSKLWRVLFISTDWLTAFLSWSLFFYLRKTWIEGADFYPNDSWRGNGRNARMPLVTRAKSYGLPETLEINGKTWFPGPLGLPGAYDYLGPPLTMG